jgi:hypothetical protein
MPFRLRFTYGIPLLAFAGCFNPSDDDANVSGSDTDSMATTTEPTSSGTTVDPTTSVSTTTEPDDTDTGDSSDDTQGEGFCGDGTVDADEACDDGVNDGSYGSCLEDCSGPAEHCGDGVVNGPEACDDGVNDGSYGGCATDCLEVGPFCGDSVVQEEHEMCDEGEDNENGSGCNVDCVTSGTHVYSYVKQNPTGSCEGETSTPVFRENGNVLLAALEYCNNGQLLVELTPELELEEETAILVSSFPTNATMRGDQWLLGSWNCDYTVSAAGMLTEICDADRITGSAVLEALDDEIYLAMKSGRVGHFGSNSPALGDSPNWWAEAPAAGPSTLYSISHAAFGALGTVVASGWYRAGSQSPYTYYGYIRRWTAGGSVQTSRTYSEMQFFNEVRSSPDGGFIIRGSGGGNALMKINQNLNAVWVKSVDDISSCNWIGRMLVDSVGDVVLECEYDDLPNMHFIKLDPDGNERWTTMIEYDQYSYGRMALDPNDWIVRAGVLSDHYAASDSYLRVDKISP